MTQTLFKFDLELIKQDVKWIQEKYDLPQIGLTHTERAIANKITESTGSNYDFDTKTYRFRETDFTEFNDEFKSTYLFEVYNTIPNIGRFRIMKMPGPSAYTIHRDQTKRYHVAVNTNPECLFLFTDLKEQHHIPSDGYAYSLDTRSRHTFVNGSKNIRTHLVLDDISTVRL